MKASAALSRLFSIITPWLPRCRRCRNNRLGRADDLVRMSALHVRRDKAALFQWVQGPPGESLPPEATGAGMEVTKCLKPPDSGHELVTARVCRPQRE